MTTASIPAASNEIATAIKAAVDIPTKRQLRAGLSIGIKTPQACVRALTARIIVGRPNLARYGGGSSTQSVQRTANIRKGRPTELVSASSATAMSISKSPSTTAPTICRRSGIFGERGRIDGRGHLGMRPPKRPRQDDGVMNDVTLLIEVGSNVHGSIGMLMRRD